MPSATAGERPRGGALETVLAEIVRLALHDEVMELLRAELPAALRAALGPPPTCPPEAVPTEVYVTATRAAEIAGVRAATIRSWVVSGELRGHHAGRLLRIRVDDLHAYLARQKERAPIDLDRRAGELLGLTEPDLAPKGVHSSLHRSRR
jgi:excisionase family DNA binding protein